jgi:hypothetical protein
LELRVPPFIEVKLVEFDFSFQIEDQFLCTGEARVDGFEGGTDDFGFAFSERDSCTLEEFVYFLSFLHFLLHHPEVLLLLMLRSQFVPECFG